MICPDYCLMLDEIYEQEKEAATHRDDDDDGAKDLMLKEFMEGLKRSSTDIR